MSELPFLEECQGKDHSWLIIIDEGSLYTNAKSYPHLCQCGKIRHDERDFSWLKRKISSVLRCIKAYC